LPTVFLLVASGSSAQRRRMMRVLMRSAAAILLIAAGFLFVPAASAQVQSPSPGLSEQSPNIPDQKLDAAAAAIERVASLKQDYQQRIAAAAPADKERILNEAVNALEKAVTDQGLSVEEYDSILEVAQNDPDVREKIRQRIRPSAQ
jgi:predicted TIM-barrel fold metal-dependent hydrolase